MTARILVVDDHFENIRFLEARLSAEYYQVVSAANGSDAIARARAQPFDIILLDVMMPGLDGFETCRRLKADPLTAHVPVVMVTALDGPRDRLRGLDAGADDFLTKPIDDMALIARLRSLTRLKAVFDELHARSKEACGTGFSSHLPEEAMPARILVVDDDAHSGARLCGALEGFHLPDLQLDPQAALFQAAEGAHALALVNLGMKSFDALRLCAQLRALERMRDMPIVLVAEQADRARILRALDLGVNDYILRPLDAHELAARIRTQLRRMGALHALRDSLRASIELASVDALTGLQNRRALDAALSAMIPACAARGEALSLVILDIDHFKRVNDRFGHDAGDDVLRVVAQRLRGAVRAGDLVCRLGGEEFAVVMPAGDLATSALVAERARLAVSGSPITLSGSGARLSVTVSAGLVQAGEGMGPRDLYRLADAALYRSKEQGRNRVSAHAA